MKDTIEKEVATSILQQPLEINVGGKKYRFHKPTTATLIAASAYIAELPEIVFDDDKVVENVLRTARDARPVGYTIATMIVSAKWSMHKGLLHWLWRWRVRRKAIRLLETCSNDELTYLLYSLISQQQISSFFGLTAFLCGINITKPTKAETTASGQQ